MSEVLSLKMMKTNKVAQWGKVLAARLIDVICVQYPDHMERHFSIIQFT